jgi:hypothetical protein
MSIREWFGLSLTVTLMLPVAVWGYYNGLEYQLLTLPLFPLIGWLIGRHLR